MKLAPYPKYKDSGVEWLGEIPEGWGVKPLKRIARLEYGCSLSDDAREDGIVPVFGSNGIIGEHSKSITGKPAIIIGRKGSYGKVSYSNVPCFPIDTTYYIDSSLTKENIRWLYYLLGSMALDQITFDTGVPGLSRDFAYTKLVPLPQIEQQTAIANFLDQKTAKIDEMIKKNKRLVEILKEKRQAIISNAVTKGLDPNARMKDSGIEWIGEIPEGWEVKRLKDLLQRKKGAIKTGPFGSQLLSSEMYDEDVKVYNQKSVITNDFEYGENYISFDKFRDLKEFQTFPGDFLITTRGTIGRCAILPQNAEQGILHPCLMRLQTNKTKVIDRFLEILIEESDVILEQLKIKSNGTTIEVIYQDSLKNVIVLIPPLPEQQSIVNYLDQKTVKIDDLTQKIQSQIETLKEYRQALISNVVTGKGKVIEA